jgi:hypothetical protein
VWLLATLLVVYVLQLWLASILFSHVFANQGEVEWQVRPL